MYSLVSGVYTAYLAPPQLNLLVVGAKGVGKTTLLERLKVTQFEKTQKIVLSPAATLPANVLKGEVPAPPPPSTPTTPLSRKKVVQTRRLSSWLCPAPPKYAMAAVDDDDDVDGSDNILDHSAGVTPERLLHRESTTGSMVSVDLESPVQERKKLVLSSESSEATPSTTTTTPTTTDATPASSSNGTTAAAAAGTAATAGTGAATTESAAAESSSSTTLQQQQEYDLKPGAKMLPLVKIRPTIGMNLGKQVPICGCQCNVWDLGGKLQHLWKRYYDDCDAVVFVWKLTLPEQEAKQQQDKNDDDSDDDSDAPPVVTYEQQFELLNQVRASIPDDVPFVVMCHLFNDKDSNTHSPIPGAFCDQRYQTAPHLMPHYHNPNTSLFFFNAATGHGVKTTMEWLIPLARQLQRLRTKEETAAEPPRHSATTGSEDTNGRGGGVDPPGDFIAKDHRAASI